MKSSKEKAHRLLPTAALAKELAGLRRTLRRTTAQYLAHLEAEIGALIQDVNELNRSRKALAEHRHALREMLMLSRQLEVKPDKGRRRDLKRIEGLVDALKDLTGQWKK